MAYLDGLPTVTTNSDMAQALAPLVSALLQCDMDMRRLRAWRAALTEHTRESK